VIERAFKAPNQVDGGHGEETVRVALTEGLKLVAAPDATFPDHRREPHVIATS
jgi:hypothetical protein